MLSLIWLVVLAAPFAAVARFSKFSLGKLVLSGLLEGTMVPAQWLAPLVGRWEQIPVTGKPVEELVLKDRELFDGVMCRHVDRWEDWM